jgi:hypothetical protein
VLYDESALADENEVRIVSALGLRCGYLDPKNGS